MVAVKSKIVYSDVIITYLCNDIPNKPFAQIACPCIGVFRA